MKRPFALIGITYLSVQAVLFYLQQNFAAVVIAVAGFIAAFAVLFAIKKDNVRHTVIGFCITAAFAGIIFGGYNAFVKEPIINKYCGREVYVTATVIDQPTKPYEYYNYLIETEEINNKKEKLKISLSTINKINVEEFDKISCVLPLSECTKNSAIADGAFLQAAANKNFAYIVKKNESKPLYYYAVKARESFENIFSELMSDDSAALCRAVLLGEQSALSQEVRNDFSRCGVSFLIVVSGMHLAIICGFVFFCIKRVIKSRGLRSLIMIICAFAFMAVTGFSSSVVRAGIMLVVVYSGKMFMRNGDSLNSLGIAGLILTVPNPTAVADVGMLLSFTATLGIILWAKGITVFIINKFVKLKRLKKPVEFLANLFAVSVSAAIWTMPFSVLMFGRVSVFSILLSFLLSPVVSIIVACALLCVIIYSFGVIGFIAYPFAFVCEWLSKFVLFVVGTVSDIPFSSVNARRPYFYLWLVLIVVIAVVGYFVKSRADYAIKSAAFSLCVLILGFGVYSVIDVNTTVINIYATGGNTVMVRRGKNCSVISCDGNPINIYGAVSDIMEDTSSLDFMIVPSDEESSLFYAEVFQRKFDESDVLIYDSNGKSNDNGNIKYFYANKILTVNLNAETKDFVISTKGGVFQYISTQNTTALLFDSKCNPKSIPEKFRKADYVITDKITENLNCLCCKKIIITGDSEENTKAFDNVTFIRSESIAVVLD